MADSRTFYTSSDTPGASNHTTDQQPPRKRSRWGDAPAAPTPVASGFAPVPVTFNPPQQQLNNNIPSNFQLPVPPGFAPIAITDGSQTGSTQLARQTYNSQALSTHMAQTNNLPGMQSTTWSKIIPSTTVGIVIGEGGSVVNRIRMLSGCAKIQVDKVDCSPGQRAVQIIGTKEQHDKAVKLIEDTLAAHKHKIEEMAARQAELEGHIKIQFDVPQRLVGLVIGTKGATIKNIKNMTGAQVNMPEHLAYPDGSRVLVISARAEIAANARNEVIRIIAEEDPDFASDLAASLGVVLERDPLEQAELEAIAIAKRRFKNILGHGEDDGEPPAEISLIHSLLQANPVFASRLEGTLPGTNADVKHTFFKAFYSSLARKFGQLDVVVEEMRNHEASLRSTWEEQNGVRRESDLDFSKLPMPSSGPTGAVIQSGAQMVLPLPPQL